MLDGDPIPKGRGNLGENVAAHCKAMGHVLDGGCRSPNAKEQFSGVVRAIQKHWQSSVQPLLPRSLQKGIIQPPIT